MTKPKRTVFLYCKQHKIKGGNPVEKARKCVERLGQEDDIEIVGSLDCGGCPGVDLIHSIKSVLDQGYDAVALSKEITGNPVYKCPCHNFPRMQNDIQSLYGDRLVDLSGELEPVF